MKGICATKKELIYESRCIILRDLTVREGNKQCNLMTTSPLHHIILLNWQMDPSETNYNGGEILSYMRFYFSPK